MAAASDDPEQVATFSEPQFPQLYREVVVIQSLWRATKQCLSGAFKSPFPGPAEWRGG